MLKILYCWLFPGHDKKKTDTDKQTIVTDYGKYETIICYHWVCRKCSGAGKSEINLWGSE